MVDKYEYFIKHWLILCKEIHARIDGGLMWLFKGVNEVELVFALEHRLPFV